LNGPPAQLLSGGPHRIDAHGALGGGLAGGGGTYYPFGAEIGSSDSPNHYKFSGKDRDAASGLDDFGARYYSIAMGRFMAPFVPFALKKR
jgi:RHS repeat-associated protein